MTHRPTICTATLFFTSLLTPVASVSQRDQPPATNRISVYAELAKAPKKAVIRRNPLANDPEAVSGGAKLFALHCAECHGEMAEGGKKAPSLLVDEVQRATPGTLFWVLTNGVVRKGMPVWSKLPDAQRWQLVTYVKSLGATASQSSSEAPQR